MLASFGIDGLTARSVVMMAVTMVVSVQGFRPSGGRCLGVRGGPSALMFAVCLEHPDAVGIGGQGDGTEEQAEDVGLPREIFSPRPEADRLDGHRREGAERVADGRQDRGAGRRCQLHLNVRRRQWHALEQLGRPRSGEGHPSVGGDDRSLARRHRARLEPIDAEQIEADRRPHDIDDRVDGPDLVEVDLRQIDPMHRRFGSTEPGEDPERQFLLPGREYAPVDDRFDVMHSAMDMLVPGFDPRVGRPEAAAAHASRSRVRQGRPRLSTAATIARRLTPASTRAPSVMSPEMPLKQSK